MNRKVCLVTGSSRGIGAKTVLAFAKEGYNVIINYVNSEEKANMLKSKIENEYNVQALVIKCDVSNEQEVKDMINKINNTFHRLDVVVNNASIAQDSLVEDKTFETFRHTLDINLIGTFLVCKYASEIMTTGSIINVASTNGIDTYYPYSLDYDASKAGVISITQNLASHYAPNIRVNAVAPGWVNTDMNKELDEEYIKEEESKILLKRFAQPEEIAHVIYFLASDNTSYINGEIIRIDGGFKC